MFSEKYQRLKSSSTTLLGRQYFYSCPTAFCIYVLLQVAIGRYSNICYHSDNELSANTYYFYNGGGTSFVVSTVLQLIKFLECMTQTGDPSAMGIYCAVFTVNLIAASSFILTVTLNWGGVCKDVLGVESTAAQWAEWLVTVPLMVYMTLAIDDKPSLTGEDLIIILVFVIAITFGFLLNLGSLPQALGYALFVLGCCSISVTVILDRLYSKKVNMALFYGIKSFTKSESVTLARASKGKTLSRLFLCIFPLFPITHLLAQLGVLDREKTLISYAICSLTAKLLFASAVADTHINFIGDVDKLLALYKITANKSSFFYLKRFFKDAQSPLRAFRKNLNTIAKENHLLTDTSKESLKIMEDAANFMNVVMEMQKVETEKTELIFEPFSIEILLRAAIQAVKSRSDAKKISFAIQSSLDSHIEKESEIANPSRLLEVLYVGDKIRLKEVIMTLLDNAIKYSYEGSQISIRLAGSYETTANNTAQDLAQLAATNNAMSPAVCALKSLLFSKNEETPLRRRRHNRENIESSVICDFTLLVSDKGVGISEDEVHTLFLPYSVRQPYQSTVVSSAGLGLMIAQEIIVRHGGEMIVSSVEGSGSTFGFCIPFNVEFKVTEKSLTLRGWDGNQSPREGFVDSFATHQAIGSTTMTTCGDRDKRSRESDIVYPTNFLIFDGTSHNLTLEIMCKQILSFFSLLCFSVCS